MAEQKRKRAGRPPKKASGKGKHPGQPGRPRNDKQPFKPYIVIGIDEGGAKVQVWRFQYVDEARQKLKNQVRIYYRYDEEIAAMESYACAEFGFNSTCSYVELYNEGKDEYHCKYWYLFDVRKVGLE